VFSVYNKYSFQQKRSHNVKLLFPSKSQYLTLSHSERQRLPPTLMPTAGLCDAHRTDRGPTHPFASEQTAKNAVLFWLQTRATGNSEATNPFSLTPVATVPTAVAEHALVLLTTPLLPADDWRLLAAAGFGLWYRSTHWTRAVAAF